MSTEKEKGDSALTSASHCRYRGRIRQREVLELVLVLELIAGTPRSSSPKIATGTATATLGFKSRGSHTPLASRPFHGFELVLTLSPISLAQLCCQVAKLPTHAVRLVVALCPQAVTQKATRSCPKSPHQLLRLARIVRSSHDAPACQPAEVL
jgi:hypothetical protein